MLVAPLVGAWIEMHVDDIGKAIAQGVAPLVGAWIEIQHVQNAFVSIAVAPLVGAWIEIKTVYSQGAGLTSLPSWERGLKLYGIDNTEHRGSRSPRGSVD